jgi:hypothetical protein
MGNHYLQALAVLRRRVAVCNAILATLAALTLPTLTARATAAQRKNAPPPAVSRQERADTEELPVTPEDIEERKREAARAVLVEQMRSKARTEVEAAAQSAHSADAGALAKALRIDMVATDEAEASEPSASALRQIGDLDGDGVAELVFRWSRPERFNQPVTESAGPLPGWVLFLLSWDGGRWRVTELMTGDGMCGLETLTGIWLTPALVGVEGLSSFPYPVIFRYQDHSATVAWDSRDGNSRYQSYASGDVSFSGDNGPPAMVVSGRADPGVIRFPSSGSRGFDVATIYFWENGAYVPKKSEFTENEDYTLYRFIAALHLHNFRAAFALIDPARFLASEEKTVDALKKQVTAAWPELLGDNIFDASEPVDGEASKFPFELNRDDVHYRYFPTFSSDGKLLLTGIERREAK